MLNQPWYRWLLFLIISLLCSVVPLHTSPPPPKALTFFLQFSIPTPPNPLLIPALAVSEASALHLLALSCTRWCTFRTFWAFARRLFWLFVCSVWCFVLDLFYSCLYMTMCGFEVLSVDYYSILFCCLSMLCWCHRNWVLIVSCCFSGIGIVESLDIYILIAGLRVPSFMLLYAFCVSMFWYRNVFFFCCMCLLSAYF